MAVSIIRLIMILICLSAVAGCPPIWKTDNPETQVSPEELFKSGEEYFQKKKYAQAIQNYEKLISAYPDNAKTPDAYMKVGDAFFDNKDYEKAIARYALFIELYPGNPEVPRAKYNIGMASFEQIKNVDLDSKIVQRAADAFKALMNDPAGGEWAKKAEEKYAECRKKQAAKEMYTAKTYVDMGRYQAARGVAKRIKDEFAKLGFDEQADELLKKIKNK